MVWQNDTAPIQVQQRSNELIMNARAACFAGLPRAASAGRPKKLDAIGRRVSANKSAALVSDSR
jgi:hypothetical protein